MTITPPLPEHLINSGYTDIRLISGNRYIAINRYLFTVAIIIGSIDDDFCFDDRWCYHSYQDAKSALDKWDGNGDPEGWHRNPRTGRRRENGKEYINP